MLGFPKFIEDPIKVRSQKCHGKLNSDGSSAWNDFGITYVAERRFAYSLDSLSVTRTGPIGRRRERAIGKRGFAWREVLSIRIMTLSRQSMVTICHVSWLWPRRLLL